MAVPEWQPGECWICDRSAVLVTWLGPVRCCGWSAPAYTCAPCADRLRARVQTAVYGAYGAPAHHN